MLSTLDVNPHETDSDVVYALKIRIRDLESVLGGDWTAPAVLRLTPAENHVLGLVVNGPITIKNIYAVRYGLHPDPPDSNVVCSLISKLRAKLCKHRISILGGKGKGYFIPPQERERLDTLYAPGERHDRTPV